MKRCTQCDGRGDVPRPDVPKDAWMVDDWMDCPDCKGVGERLLTDEEIMDCLALLKHPIFSGKFDEDDIADFETLCAQARLANVAEDKKFTNLLQEVANLLAWETGTARERGKTAGQALIRGSEMKAKMTKDKQISLLLAENRTLQTRAEKAEKTITATKKAMKEFEKVTPDFEWPFQREYKNHIEPEDRQAPFMSENCLYPLIHKEQARTVLGMWRQVKDKIGMEDEE